MNRKKLVWLLALFFQTALTIEAQPIVLKIGEGTTLYLSSRGDLIKTSTQWSTTSSHISLSNMSDNSCYVTAISSTGDYYATVNASVTGENIHTGKPGTHNESFSIKVWDGKPQTISIYPISSGWLTVNDTYKLGVSCIPDDADWGSTTWTSSNTNVATVIGSKKECTVYAHAIGQTTITATTDNGITSSGTIYVYGNSPTAISISGATSVDAEEQIQLSTSFTPSDHRSTLTWTSSNTNVATVNQNGLVSALNPGETTITVTTGNGISDSKTITVNTPELILVSYSPTQNETEANVMSSGSFSYSHAISEGPDFNKISVYETLSGQSVDYSPWFYGTDDKKTVLIVSPYGALKPNTSYTFFIPKRAVINKWGGTVDKDLTLTFTTGNLNQMTLTARRDGKNVYLDCSEYDAQIYYTLDGTDPTPEHGTSLAHGKSITLSSSALLWAKAYKIGFASPEIKQWIYLGMPNVECLFPPEEKSVSLTPSLIPYVEFDKDISWANQGASPTVREKWSSSSSSSYYCDGEFIISGKRMFFIPEENLTAGHIYTIQIPAGTVVGPDGEKNEAYSGTFGELTPYTPYGTKLEALDIPETVINMQVGEKTVVPIKPVPLNAYYYCTWNSSDESVVETEYGGRGIIKAKKKGTAVITASYNGLTASCTIIVGDITETAPYLVYTSPEDGATDVPLNVRPYMKFSEYTDLNRDLAGFDYLKIMLSDADGNFVERSRGVEVTGELIQLTPSEDLQPTTRYTMSIPAGYLHNIKTGAVSTQDFSFSFTTGTSTGIQTVGTDTKTYDIYNLQGHKIRSKVSTTDGLSKGIYIINGKKMVVQ